MADEEAFWWAGEIDFGYPALTFCFHCDNTGEEDGEDVWG